MLVERKKRIFDFFASLILIIVTLPLQIIIYLVIFIIQKDNPLFIQERGLTLEKFRFRMIKFRTLKKLILNQITELWEKAYTGDDPQVRYANPE